MSSGIDERIVSMQFDNKDFDKNIRKSQKSLEEFKKSLNFESAAQQMESLSEKGLIGSKFSEMANNLKKLTRELAGVGNIGTYVAKKFKTAWEGALNAVERFTKSLSSGQIKPGFDKYEGYLKSVQTIMNATGDSEEYVYGVLGKLVKYTDETSYDFASMAQNISKFTTAGVSLGDAEKEMEGIANWAALSGQGINEASRAMFNISQAMSAGAMLKIDWKSIQNAGMDTREFRKEALEAAVAAGTLKKTADGMYKTVKGGKTVNIDNFTETLQFRWFDKKTMETVFKTFGDQSTEVGKKAYKAAQRCITFKDVLNAWKDLISTGWMKTFEHIFGKLSDAMALFSGLCNKVGDSFSELIDLRNGVLSGWNLAGGRDSLWGALFGEMESPDGEKLFAGAYGILDAIQDIGKAIKEAFYEFVGMFMDPEDAERADQEEQRMAFLSAKLVQLSNRVKEFAGRIKDFLFKVNDGETESRFDKIKHIAQAVFAAVTFIAQVIHGVGQFIGEIITQLHPAISAIEQLIDWLLQLFTGAVVDGAKKNTVGNFFHKLAEILKPFTTIINVVVRALVIFIAKVATMIKQSGLLQYLGSVIQYVSNAIGQLVVKAINSGVFQKIFEWIQIGISKIPAFIQKMKELGSTFLSTAKKSKAVTSIGSFIKKLFGGKNAKDVLTTLKTKVSELIKKIPEILPDIKTAFINVFSKISDFLGNLFFGLFAGSAKAEDGGSSSVVDSLSSAIVKPIKELGKGNIIKDAFDKVKPGLFEKTKTGLKDLWAKITEFFTNLANSEGIKKIKSFFAGTSFKDILVYSKDILKWFAILRGGSGLASLGKGIKSFGKGVKVFGKNLKNLDLSNMFKIFSGNSILSGNTDNSKSKVFNLDKLGNQLLQIAGAIFLIVLAAEKIIKMKPDELKAAGITLAVIIAALVGAGVAAKHFTGNGSGLLALAVAVLALIVPMNILQKMSWGVLLDGVVKLAAIIFMLALAGRVAGKVQMKGFVGLAAAILILLIPLKSLMKMPLLGKNGEFGGLIQGMSALILLIMAMAVAARISGGNEMKGMVGLAVAITILMIPIKMLAAMPWPQALQGVLALVIILAAITAMIKITSGAEPGKLSAIVAAVSVLALIGYIIGKTMSWDQALVGFAPIILILILMTAMLKAAKNLTPQKLKGLTQIFYAFTIAIAVITGTIVALSLLNVDPGLIAIVMGSVILIIAAVGIMCKLIGSANSRAVAKISVVFLSLTLLIAVAGGCLVAMSMFKVEWGVVAAFLGGLSLLLVSVGFMVKTAFKTTSKGLDKVWVVLLALSAVIAVAGAALFLMAKEKIDWKVVLGFTVGLAALIAALGFAIPALAKIDVTAAIKAILILAAGVVAISLALSIVIPIILGSIGNSIVKLATKMKTMSGLLKSFFGRMDTIEESSIEHTKKVFDELKDMLKKFSGLSGYDADIQSFMGQLNDLGTGLDLFFVNDGKYPDPENSNSFKVLNKFIEIGPSLLGFNSGTLPEQLMYIGAGLMLFDELTKNITTSEPIALTLLQGIFGQADNIKTFAELPIESFVEQMTALGGAMSLYAKGAKEVTGLEVIDGEVPDISDSVTILKAICKAISGEDGSGEFTIPDNMPDETKLGLFAGQLEALGTALSTFATAAKGMETNTSKAMALLGFLAEIGGYVTSENLEVIDVFPDDMHVDENGKGGKLGQFALDITALGGALSTFAENIGGKEAQFSTGLGVLDKFSELNQKLTKDKLAFLSVFDDKNMHKSALDIFAEDIGSLGHALASFAQNVVNDDGSAINFDNAIDALKFLANLEVKLSAIKMDGIAQWFTGNSATLGTLADDVQQLGQALSDFSEAITGVGEEGTAFNGEAALDAMDVLAKMMGLLNVINVEHTGEWNGLTDRAHEIISFFSMLFDEDVGAASFADGSFIAAIANFAKDLSTAFKEVEGIDPAAVKMFQELADGISKLILFDSSESFHYPGEMISEGIAKGVENGRSRVVNAIVDVVQAGIDAGEERAGIASPSKVFAEMGHFMDLGLVKGLDKDQDLVERAGADTAQKALDSAIDVLGMISSAMDESMDLQPTITPVLDLSNISGAGSTIGSLFSGYALNLDAALGRVNAKTDNNTVKEVIVANPPDLNGIQGSIVTLQNEIAGLQSAITRMKIVLNTGEVAGSVTDAIDFNLGLKNLYASRRN